jgi:hypothetical protein
VLLDIEAVREWKPEPGDVLVVQLSCPMPREAIARIRHTFRDEFPEHRLMILEKGMKFEVYRGEPDTGVRTATEGVKLLDDEQELHCGTEHSGWRARASRWLRT